MTDYKQTLNLPETEFPMRGNLAKREPDMLASWIAADWHQQIREVQSSREQTFILHDGPPYRRLIYFLHLMEINYYF